VIPHQFAQKTKKQKKTKKSPFNVVYSKKIFTLVGHLEKVIVMTEPPVFVHF
jgi:hypothetical protein